MPRAARQDLIVSQEGTLDVVLRLKSNGEPMDLDGWAVRARVGDLYLSPYPNANGSSLLPTDDARYELYVSNDDLQGLDLPVSWSLLLTSPTGDPQPYVTGYVVADL